MRPGPSDRLAGGHLRRTVRVSSWLGTSLLAESVPVVSLTWEDDDGQDIPEKATLTVPVGAAGGPWDPTGDPRHPLADFGQRLAVELEWSTPRGVAGITPMGWVQIQKWDLDDDEAFVTVTAHGLLQIVADDEFRAPEQPRKGGSFGSEVRRLAPGGMPVSISPDLTDRACPGSFTWEDRLGALLDLAAAWPARLTVSADGALTFGPPLAAAPEPVVLTLTDGEEGVIISLPRSSSREARYNSVVARSAEDDPDSTPVTGEWTSPAGSGPFDPATYGVVRRKVASPLIGTTTAAVRLARTTALASQRRTRIFTVSMPPDWRIERGDPVALVWRGARHTGWVQSVAGPLHVPSTPVPMVLTVGCPV